jgi:hypothetical protein
MRRAVLALAGYAALASALAAQDATYRTITVPSGRAVRLSAHFNLQKDCSPGPAPEVRVITAPQHGVVSVRTAKVRARRVRNCENVEAPVRLVFYRSNPAYTGEDQVTYEMKKADGSTEVQSVTIKVTPASAAPSPRREQDGRIEL